MRNNFSDSIMLWVASSPVPLLCQFRPSCISCTLFLSSLRVCAFPFVRFVDVVLNLINWVLIHLFLDWALHRFGSSVGRSLLVTHVPTCVNFILISFPDPSPFLVRDPFRSPCLSRGCHFESYKLDPESCISEAAVASLSGFHFICKSTFWPRPSCSTFLVHLTKMIFKWTNTFIIFEISEI